MIQFAYMYNAYTLTKLVCPNSSKLICIITADEMYVSCVPTHTHTHTHVHIRLHTHTHTQRLHTYAYTYTHTPTHTEMHRYAYILHLFATLANPVSFIFSLHCLIAQDRQYEYYS